MGHLVIKFVVYLGMNWLSCSYSFSLYAASWKGKSRLKAVGVKVILYLLPVNTFCFKFWFQYTAYMIYLLLKTLSAVS